MEGLGLILTLAVAIAWGVGVPFVGGYIYATSGSVAGFAVALVPVFSQFIFEWLKATR